jgi:hypothetical protein
MERVYNLKYPEKSVEKGLVEIVNTWGQIYYSLFVDGKYITYTHKESYEKEVIKRSFIKNAVKLSGVDEENLTFVIIDAHDFMGQDKDYDANFYMDREGYDNLLDLVKRGGINKMSKSQCYFLAKGVTQLEDKI